MYHLRPGVTTIFYNCPMCDKKESSFDGETYCGSCEERYQKEQAEKENNGSLRR